MVAGFETREIIEAFRHVETEDPARVFAGVEGRLGESGRALLHQAIAADHTEEDLEEDLAWTQAVAVLERLRSDARKRYLSDLKARVKSAEREGRVQDALALYAELDELGREQRGAS